MNKKSLCAHIAEKTKLPPQTVEIVLDSFKETVIRLLGRGEQLHWGGFIRIWSIMKRPVDKSGQPIYDDTLKNKIRYLKPDCTFATSLGKGMKEIYYNIAVKDWANKPPLPPMRKQSRKIKYMEIT